MGLSKALKQQMILEFAKKPQRSLALNMPQALVATLGPEALRFTSTLHQDKLVLFKHPATFVLLDHL